MMGRAIIPTLDRVNRSLTSMRGMEARTRKSLFSLRFVVARPSAWRTNQAQNLLIYHRYWNSWKDETWRYMPAVTIHHSGNHGSSLSPDEKTLSGICTLRLTRRRNTSGAIECSDP